MAFELSSYSLNSLKHRRTRTFLTVLGIIVGISALLLLVGLVQGLKQDVVKQLEGFGPRTLIITPTNFQKGNFFGGGSLRPTSGKLFIKDFERVKSVPSIKTITKVISGGTTLTYKDQSINSQIFAVEPDAFRDTLGVELAQGRFITSNDRQSIVLGGNVAESFKKPVPVSAVIQINGKDYKVVGVLKKTGNSFGPVDDVIFMSYDEGQEIFKNALLENEISAIRITLREGSDVESEVNRIEDIMVASHHVTKDTEDFGILSPTFINKQFTTILDQLTVFLGAIASISLIVGAIGIANTMFMSVMERRKEIGTLKALGATETKIRDAFLIESSLLGFIGGLIGLIIATSLGFVISFVGHITFVNDPFVIFGALLFSVIVGVVSGTFPAIEAAKVDPIVALRYE